jgi:predicted Rossmann fold nucleotide-binding protein DprA/Smf involved in DNA uptake
MIILGITGTRAGPRPAQTAAALKFMRGLKPYRVVHGGAPGFDMIAHGIAETLRVREIEVHPSTVRSPSIIPGAGVVVYPELPPLERNRVIIKRVYGLLACPKTDDEELRSGTWATVRYARKAGVPVYIIKQDGRIVADQTTFDRWIAPL